MTNQSKIEVLGLGDFILKLHKGGVSHYDISKEIKNIHGESVHSQTIYRWIRTNVTDYVAPKFQSDNLESTNLKESIDFTEIENLINNPVALANCTQQNLLSSFLKISMIINQKLSEYNDTNRIPLNEIKSLKLITEIMQTFTNRGLDQNNIMQIKDSLDIDI